MSGIRLEGNTSGRVAEVTANNELQVALGLTPATIGGARIFSENDPGDITGTPLLMSPETSLDYRVRVGLDTLIFCDTFNATTQNTNNWSYTFGTLTASMPGAGTVNFGTVQGTAAGHGAFMRTFPYFPVYGAGCPLYVEITAGQFTAPLVNNEVFAFGLGLPGGAATLPTDAVYVQITTAGVIGVLAYNGTVTQTGVLASLASLALNSLYKWTITVGEGTVEFWQDDVLLGKLEIPVGNGQPFMQASLPMFFQKLCTGSVSNTNTMRVSDVSVSLGDLGMNKPWSHVMAGAGQSAYVAQNGGTMGGTALMSNAAPAAAAALVNISAAAQFQGLGGIFRVLPTLTAGTDGILCSYTNPAGTINITGRKLFITGVRIQSIVEVTLTGGPLNMLHSIAFGHIADTLASTETASFVTATTKKPRYIPIGFESCVAAAAAGTALSNGLNFTFQSPICINPGERIAIASRNMGTVTTLGNLLIAVAFDGYFQ